jgi:urease accessory protein UreF
MPEEFNLLFQVGMVGAFIYYALRRDRREAAERSKRDNDWQRFITALTETFKQALADRDEAMTEALRLDREQRREGMDAGTGFVSQLAASIEKLTNALLEHENEAQKRHFRTMEAIKRTSTRRTNRTRG